MNEDLLRDMVRQDFVHECERIAFSMKLPKRKRLLYDLGLYVPSFAEWERLMGKRHWNDPRP